MPRYEAVIFDMDGVLADSEPVFHEAMLAVLEPLGHTISEQQQRDMMGSSTAGTWRYLQETFGIEGPLDALIEDFERQLPWRLAQIHEPLPGVRELLAALRARDVPLGLASSSLPEWIEALLGGLGLTDAFNTTVSARYAARPKPAPDVYLLAASRLGIEPGRCIAVEDTPTGLASAKGAGMLTVQVRAASTAFPPLPDADVVIETLREFDLELLG